MNSIFGVAWNELGPEHVRAFLESAGDETLLWEAKGGGLTLAPESVRKAVCGFANSRGGFLILGSDGSAKAGRSLVGLTFPDEPRVWLDSVIRDGVRPVPAFDVHAWLTDGDRHCAVVMVEPTPIPPCITTEGSVYERVSGRTVPVIDPAELARLSERGQAARASAEGAALGAADRVTGEHELARLEDTVVRVGLAATGRPDDVGALLFKEETQTSLRDIVAARLRPSRYSKTRGVMDAVRQDRIVARTVEPPGTEDHVWTASLSWDGAAGVIGSSAEKLPGVELFVSDTVRPAVFAAAEALRLIGGYGPAHLTLDVIGEPQLIVESGTTKPLPDFTRVRRWLDGEPDDELFASIKRELLRASGYPEWEP